MGGGLVVRNARFLEGKEGEINRGKLKRERERYKEKDRDREIEWG